MKLEFSREIFEKYSNIKFNENRIVGAMRTDKHDEAKFWIYFIFFTGG